MNMGTISLFVLVLVVALGFIKKINIGFLAIGAARLCIGTARRHDGKRDFGRI